MSFTVEKLTKQYGNKPILKEISFEISFGSCIGILGVNGSGKSTLLSILAGIQKAGNGRFMYEGNDLLKDAKTHAAVVGYVPQGTPLIEELTAYDNLLLWYSKTHLKAALQDGILSLLGVDEFLKKRVSTLSGGMKKRLSIACSMAGDPKILLLDEPSAAIDFVGKQRIAAYVQQFVKQGGAVLIATHDVSELSWCDCTFLLKDGVLVPYKFEGDLQQLTDDLR